MFNRSNLGTISPVLVNVTFSGNQASGDYGGGGGMYNYSFGGTISPVLTNVTFSGNQAYYCGGMVNSTSMAWGGISNPVLDDVILWGNSGAQICNYDYGSATVNYSLVQGGCPDGATCSNLLVADPRFMRDPDPGLDGIWGTADDDYGDLRLRPGSPAIDAGDNDAVPPSITTDLDGNPRFVDILIVPDTGSGTPPIVDMGAYEVQWLYAIYFPLVLKGD